MTQEVSTLHFEAKHLALHTAGLQSELCLEVQLVCLLGSAAQKYSFGLCLLLGHGKPTPINREPGSSLCYPCCLRMSL